MQKKKLTALLLSCLMLAALALPAAATANTQQGTYHGNGPINSETTSSPSYTVTIPASLNPTQGGWNPVAGGINVTAAYPVLTESQPAVSGQTYFDTSKKLKVDVTSNSGWRLRCQSTEQSIYYTLLSDETSMEDIEGWEFLPEDVTKQGGKTYNFGIYVDEDDYAHVKAGEYTDILFFQFSVEPLVEEVELR